VQRAWRENRAVQGAAIALAVPLALLALLRVRPALDAVWRNHPAHFWLVLTAAGVATTLGYAVTVAAQRRRDARLLLIALGFTASAGFLGLHALATPGVLLGPNAGFEFATPVGLVLGSAAVAASAREFSAATAQAIVARTRALRASVAVIVVGWAVASLAEVPPLDEPVASGTLKGWLVAFAIVGAAAYGTAAVGYARLYRDRGAPVARAFAIACALLAGATITVAFAVNWGISWWEWHVLMLAAFGLVATAARQEWHEERFSALYLERTLHGTGEVSVLFADLQGFTPFSERTDAQDVHAMLNSYFSRLVPLMQELGGHVHQLIGDAVMVVFNPHGDQPDHAVLAARAALAFQDAAQEVATAHPDWPRFRVGVNSGEVASGVLGDRGHRKHGITGDTVNLAARLEGEAPVGKVVIGEGTLDRLPEGTVVQPLPPLQVKGKEQPVTAHVLLALPPDHR